jgi:hypothetical protein
MAFGDNCCCTFLDRSQLPIPHAALRAAQTVLVSPIRRLLKFDLYFTIQNNYSVVFSCTRKNRAKMDWRALLGNAMKRVGAWGRERRKGLEIYRRDE